MPKCKGCAAPLPSDSNVCVYCGVRNDIDLKGVHDYTVANPESDRICPVCNINMRTINLGTKGNFLIEQCEECLGLFFDPGELEALMEKSVSNVYDVDFKKIRIINDELDMKHQRPMYVKCPVCQAMMNRLSFGTKSGVVVDRCKEHGIWLDSGELKHLFEWSKAGGQILDQERKLQEKREKEWAKEKKRLEAAASSGNYSGTSGKSQRGDYDYASDDLTNLICKVAYHIFD